MKYSSVSISCGTLANITLDVKPAVPSIESVVAMIARGLICPNPIPHISDMSGLEDFTFWIPTLKIARQAPRADIYL